MNVKKCDRKGCETIYDPYGHQSGQNDPNATQLVCRDMQGEYRQLKTFDLCPKCMQELKVFLGGAER